MKYLNEYIFEKLKLNNKSKSSELYSPETLKELADIIEERMIECKNKNLSILDLNDIDTSKISTFESLFYALDYKVDADIKEIRFETWNTKNVKEMGSMFANCEKLEKVDISNWDVSNVENMTGMFNNCTSLKSVGNLDNWNTRNLTNVNWLFGSCKLLESVGNLDNWDVRNIKRMNMLFSECYNLQNIGDISNWKIESVDQMTYFFEECRKLKNVGDLNKWEPYIESLKPDTRRFSYHSKIKKPKWER